MSPARNSLGALLEDSDEQVVMSVAIEVAGRPQLERKALPQEVELRAHAAFVQQSRCSSEVL
jgi:hypothetical protein